MPITRRMSMSSTTTITEPHGGRQGLLPSQSLRVGVRMVTNSSAAVG